MRFHGTNAGPLVALAMAMAVGAAGAACDKGSSAGDMPAASASAHTAANGAASASASAAASAAAPSDAGMASNADAEAAEDDQVENEAQAHQRHHHAGFAGFVFSSLETLGLAADQEKAVEAVKKEYHAKMKPLAEANGAVIQLLADGIAAGTIDKAKVDVAVGKASAAAVGLQAAVPNVLNELHTALKPEQRTALVDKVDANFATWNEVNGGGDATMDGGAAPPPSAPGAHKGGGGDHMVGHVAKELSLTSDQVSKFKSALATAAPKKPFDPTPFETYLKAFDAAFVVDPFDAKKLPPAGPESAKMVTFGSERMATFYETLTPILTPDQRAKLADKLKQEHANVEKEKP